MAEVPIVVPTHKRAGRVRTFEAVSDLILCVAKKQESEYRKAYPEAKIEVHPDKVVGLAPKRNWMLSHFGDHFSLDDDVTEMRRIYDPDAPPRMTAEEAYEAVQATAHIAREVGAKLWGFSNYPMTYTFDVFKPFRTVGYVNGMAMGIFADSQIRFPEDPAFMGSDYYVSGLNAFHHRYIWLDTRFAFAQHGTFRNLGGQSEYRNMETEEESYRKLRHYFGNAIELKHGKGARPPDTSDERKSANAGHPFEKVLKVPW
jgi:hypothetical protein